MLLKYVGTHAYLHKQAEVVISSFYSIDSAEPSVLTGASSGSFYISIKAGTGR